MVRILLLAALAAPTPVLGQETPAGEAPAAGEATAGGAVPAPGGGAPTERVPGSLLAEIDAAYARRDEPGAMEAMRSRLEEADKAAPGEYELLWRLARHYFWLADDPGVDRKEKSRLGKTGWAYGDRATAANPERVEGWHYAAAGVGSYALGIGVFTALRQGIEGKFKERLSRAERIDPGFQDGAIQTAWGRFWYELPWPKHSARKSRKALEDALRRNEDNVRARVYLADLLLKEDEPEKARAELERALAHPPGRYDAPEERRWQDVARKRLAAQ